MPERLGVKRRLNPPGVAHSYPWMDAAAHEAVLCVVGVGEDRAVIRIEQFDRCSAIAGQVCVRPHQLHVNAAGLGIPAKVSKAIIKG